MTQAQRKPVSAEQWNDATLAYELGTKHAAQIARELGVSPATVSREFKRRGCRKACRVAEIVAAINAEFDAKDRANARRREIEEAIGAERVGAFEKLIDVMMESLIAADRAGNLAALGPAIEKTRKSLGIEAFR